ncbi:hypothetical protein HOH45_08650 [bacterium]|nr:hypothetical protein [bacterium]
MERKTLLTSKRTNSTKQPRVLAITTSRDRPHFIRYCALQMAMQSVSVDHAIFINAKDPANHRKNYISLLDDIDPRNTLFLGFGQSIVPHHNHCAAMGLADRLDDYDIILKIDDDDLYRHTYVEEVLQSYDEHNWDFSGSHSEGILNKRERHTHTRHESLGLKERDIELGVPPMMPNSFALSKKAVKAVRSLDIPYDKFIYEDVIWRRFLVGAPEFKVVKRDVSGVTYNIHGLNHSIPMLKKEVDPLPIKKYDPRIGWTLKGRLSLEHENPRVLVFLTSRARPTFLRAIILQLLAQDIPVDISIYLNHNDYLNSFFNYGDMLKDLPVRENCTVYFQFGPTLTQHNNYMASLAQAPLTKYDLFLKVDDDDIYRSGYARSVLESYDKHAFDVSGGYSEGIIIDSDWFKDLQLKEKGEACESVVGFTFAFSKKGVFCLSDILPDSRQLDSHGSQNLGDTWRTHFEKNSDIYTLFVRENTEASFYVHGDNYSKTFSLIKK